MKKILDYLIIILPALTISCNQNNNQQLQLNDPGYFEMPGLNVMAFSDYYPEGHQGGVSIIHHGIRIATNGDVRLEATPGQWQPIPKLQTREVDYDNNEIRIKLSYPDSGRHEKGFNPISYPDLHFKYQVRVAAEGKDFRISVDLEKPLPEEWIGKVGFNMELFPGALFGKSYQMDDGSGIFPHQANGPAYLDREGNVQIEPLASGQKFTLAPETKDQCITIQSLRGEISLIDGRINHNNGWFVLRSVIPENATKGAIEWIVQPKVIPGWISPPVIHLSQVGYHPHQPKIAVIETDKSASGNFPVSLLKITSDNKKETVIKTKPEVWGRFLRYKYLHFDFSSVLEEGMYMIRYGDAESNPFKISKNIYSRHVWQPTLEYFLPVQMCHMEVKERYRTWHGRCHLDDALMAPVNYNHFDGYRQGPSTLCKYKPMDPLPGLNSGGWHDAGDYDLRVESQAGTVLTLVRIYEEFGLEYDQTTIDQETKSVEIHRPDGKNDLLQQVEHGILTILGGYQSLGRLYRGIICPTLEQYVLLGDGSTMTDNIVYKDKEAAKAVPDLYSGKADDRWVFTEENPSHEYDGIAALAAASRVLKEYDDQLAEECIQAAVELWDRPREIKRSYQFAAKLEAAVELFITTENNRYRDFILKSTPEIIENIDQTGWMVAYAVNHMGTEAFDEQIKTALAALSDTIKSEQLRNPFGVPYEPKIWGHGWDIQRFGMQQYYLHKALPDVFDPNPVFNALNFMLGCHPGSNTASFASGVGSNSVRVAYGVNRADWSFIPGGVVSGTALIRPDFPELKEWPYLWQQTEYVMGGGATNFMFLVLAVERMVRSKK